MAEAQLHKERLQALAEKRKRQAEIEDKRGQLEDLVLQLQHLKSKATRERWLLQGTPSGSEEEEEGRRRQLLQDEEQGKTLEDTIHRLESEIELLENEESQISAKEQVLRERLRETERSIEDLQKSLQYQDGDVVHGENQSPRTSLSPSLPDIHSAGDSQPPRKPAMFAMEINVEKDRRTGDTRILSAEAVSPDQVPSRGVKVFDDGRKVVYEVRSGGGTTLENGVQAWSSAQVDQLMQRVGQPTARGEGGRGQVTVTLANPDNNAAAAPSIAPPPIPTDRTAREQTVQREARLGAPPPTVVSQPIRSEPLEGEVMGVPTASVEHPVTMVFMGYQSVLEDEGRHLLGFDGTIKAEIVLIDEDDEKSLREKTVTDVSAVDGNAADLVSGRPLSDTTTELSSEGPDPSSPLDAPPPPGRRQIRRDASTSGNRPTAATSYKQPHTAMKPTRASEDDGELRRDKALKTVSFHDSVSVITAPHCNMELDAHHESQHGFHESQHGFSDSQHDYPESQHDYPESQHGYPESQHGCPESQHGGQNGLGSHSKVLDSEVAQEIRYLDQVLEANGCDGSTDGPTNGTSTPECSEVHIDGSSPSVFVSGMTPPSGEEVRVEGGRQTTFVDTEVNPSNGHSADSSFSSSSSFSSTSSFSSAKKEAPRFELRAFQEERKPSRLFETPTEKEVRVKKVRPSEEMLELERERLELIRGQAVKKNPGIATKWWNPPQERTLEEELDPEQLDSHRKYQQRKQQRSQAPGYAHMASQPPVVTFDLPETTSGEDVVVEQIDFLAARKQFLQSEQAKQGGGTRRDVAPQIYSAKPFSVSTGNRARSPLAEPGDVTTAQMERINYSSEESPPPGKSHMTWAEEGGGDFTCARAVMTILREEDSEGRAQPLGSSYHLEEFDSGLDELSLRSQDTAVLETLSNDLSLDTVSDQDALSLPPTPQPTTPVNGRLEPGPLAPPGYAGPSEAELEYHAGILVQNAIQQALVSQEQDWPPSHSLLSPTHTLPSSMPSPQTQSSPLSSTQTQSSPLPLTSPSPSFPSTSPLPASSTHQPPPDKLSVTLSPNPHQFPTTSPPAQRPSPGPERREGGPRIRVQSSYARALAAAPDPTPAPAPAVAPAPSRPTQPYPAPPSSPPREKQEFSYFSKYSEAAELRSTAATHAPEAETSAGPFRLRSRKQKTLSVIEAEIRAAQEREEELKKQRQTLGVRPAPGHAPGNRQTQRVTISPGDKMKTNSLPARLTLTSRTAPGKIEKIRPAPPVSPSSSEGPPASPLSDQGSDDSGGRPKNFMQTLMEDYETHKVKRRDKQEDNSVLEATRVTRRKSNMALKWEAGIYANQDEGEEEEEEEEEEE